MMISTRGRYALRVMIDLAEDTTGGYVPLKRIAKRQGISEKYLEAILPALIKHQLLQALRGKGGGYKLARPAETYSAASILRPLEGNFAPVSCLECDASTCPRAPHCKTLPMWAGLHNLIDQYLEGITLADLCKGGTHEELAKQPID